jgi:hypothetical protein
VQNFACEERVKKKRQNAKEGLIVVVVAFLFLDDGFRTLC